MSFITRAALVAGAVTACLAATVGVSSAAISPNPYSSTADTGRLTLMTNVRFLVTHITGTACLFAGTLTGSVANGSGSFTVSGLMREFRNLGLGGCAIDGLLSARVTVATGATVTW